MSRYSIILPSGSVLLKNEETGQVLRLSAEDGPLCLGTIEMQMSLNPAPVHPTTLTDLLGEKSAASVRPLSVLSGGANTPMTVIPSAAATKVKTAEESFSSEWSTGSMAHEVPPTMSAAESSEADASTTVAETTNATDRYAPWSNPLAHGYASTAMTQPQDESTSEEVETAETTATVATTPTTPVKPAGYAADFELRYQEPPKPQFLERLEANADAARAQREAERQDRAPKPTLHTPASSKAEASYAAASSLPTGSAAAAVASTMADTVANTVASTATTIATTTVAASLGDLPSFSSLSALDTLHTANSSSSVALPSTPPSVFSPEETTEEGADRYSFALPEETESAQPAIPAASGATGDVSAPAFGKPTLDTAPWATEPNEQAADAAPAEVTETAASTTVSATVEEQPIETFVMPKIDTPVPVLEPGLHETMDRAEHGDPWMPPPVLPTKPDGFTPTAAMDAKSLAEKINALKSLLERDAEDQARAKAAAQANALSLNSEPPQESTLTVRDYPGFDKRQLAEIPDPVNAAKRLPSGRPRDYIPVLDAPFNALTMGDFETMIERLAAQRNTMEGDIEYLEEIEAEQAEIDELADELERLDEVLGEVVRRKEAFEQASKPRDEDEY